MQQEKAERITITLPPDMLASIKKEIRSPGTQPSAGVDRGILSRFKRYGFL